MILVSNRHKAIDINSNQGKILKNNQNKPEQVAGAGAGRKLFDSNTLLEKRIT